MTARYSLGTATFTVHGASSRSYDVDLSATGGVTPEMTSLSVTAGPSGVATFEVPVGVGTSRRGSLTAVLAFGGDSTPLQNSGSLWLEPTADGGVAQGTSQIEAEVNAIRQDYPTGQAQRDAMEALAQVGSLQVSHLATARLAASASGTAVISGLATYQDWNLDAQPARHITVSLDETGLFGSHLATTTTNDMGRYSFTVSLDGATDVKLTFLAESSAASVGNLPLGIDEYSELTNSITLNPGDDMDVNVDLGGKGAIGNAFVIHDALWTAHLFAEASGHSGEPAIDVYYPSLFDGNDEAYTNSAGMTLGAWEWSAWDVINHEYGHWYDMQHGISTGIGGDHCIDSNLASNNCNDNPVFGKDDGGKLAWSEGYADYYSVASGKLADHPLIATVGDGIYDDTMYSETGVRQETSFTAAADNSNPSRYHGEDNEFAIAGALVNAATLGSAPLGARNMSTLLESAGAQRFSDFVNYVWPDDMTSHTSRPTELDFNRQLSDARIAPYDLTSTEASLSAPPTLSWQPGNTANPGTPYPNDSFTVQAIDPTTASPYFASSATSDTSWTPTGREWSQIAAGRSTVHLRVVGTSTSSPETGPYRGRDYQVAVHSGALVNAASCNASTLPANDDGSTGAVDLPFPVNFFGATYTYLYVNNNGNVTFNEPMSTHTPFTIDADTPPIIAPFFADVDTRGDGSAAVTYGTTVFDGRQAFCVNWIDVGYFDRHDDKLVSAQLLLVDRSDQGAGDFDIMFNYGHIGWETGDASGGGGGGGGIPSSVAMDVGSMLGGSDGFGGVPVGVGYSAGGGDVDTFYQMPGSLQTRQFTDGGLHALVSNSIRATTHGRYLFPVRNGDAGNSSTGISGTVTSSGSPVAGAPIQVCPHSGGQCVFQTRTALDGTYDAVGIRAGTYDVTVYPPSGLNAVRVTVPAVEVTRDNLSIVDVELKPIGGVAPGTTLNPLVGSGGQPMVNWRAPLTLRATGCLGGNASVEVLSTEGGSDGTSIAAGPMSGDGQGHFWAVFAPLYPEHGSAAVRITIMCPDGSVQTTQFDIYIDPSGRVLDQAGNAIAGATVTLSRSDTPDGEFVPVADGSDLMSPANRANPMTTGTTGAFGWDAVAGYYKVVASKDGCTSATTDVLTVPPPALDLDLVLICEVPDVQAPVITVADQQLEGNARGGWHGDLPGVGITDPDSPADEVTLTNDAPNVLPLGTTTVTWTATDPAGNTSTARQTVTVVDTTAPSITCPPNLNTTYTHTPQLGTPALDDVVDAAPTATAERPASWPIGTSNVTWTATDASGNDATCTQTVTLSVPADLTAATRSTSLVGEETVAPGGTLSLDAAVPEPDGTASHADVVGRVYAVAADGTPTDLGDVTFDSEEKATVTLPAAYAGRGEVRIAVVFDATPLLWDTVQVAPVAPTWDPTAVYQAGDVVLYDGRRFQAQWWTQNQTPGASPFGPWAEIGASMTCEGRPAQQWTASWIYTGGQTVVHNGSVWTAKWWTRNQEPGATSSGPWEPAGTC